MQDEYPDAVGVLPFPQRVARAVGESPVSERVADAQEFVYGPVLDWARRSPLHTDALGHSVHPLLTDLTLGCWISASILDLAGGAQERRAATLLVGSGLAAAVPTAIAGTRLGLAGNVVAAGAGFLGGHMALNRGTARRTVG